MAIMRHYSGAVVSVVDTGLDKSHLLPSSLQHIDIAFNVQRTSNLRSLQMFKAVAAEALVRGVSTVRMCREGAEQRAYMRQKGDAPRDPQLS